MLSILLFCVVIYQILCQQSYLIVIRSQGTPVDNYLTTSLKSRLKNEGIPGNRIIIQNKMKDPDAMWTYYPLFVYAKKKQSVRPWNWLILLEPSTKLTKAAIDLLLSNLDPTTPIYLGEGVIDEGMPSIRHSYSIEKWPYPIINTDLAFSSSLVAKIADRYLTQTWKPDFHIDAEWSLARYIYEGFQVELQPWPELSSLSIGVDGSSTPLLQPPPNIPKKYKRNLKKHEVVLGVKTVDIYHSTRLATVAATWGPKVPNKIYYSNVNNPDIPTIESPNTESGHCAKLYFLLHHLYQTHGNKMKFYVVVDDDTLLHYGRLIDVLSYFDPDKPIFAGDRYGYGFHNENTRMGYNYMTGGSGMILSREALKRLVECKYCTCPQPNSPDDMYLGQWMRHELGIPSIHIPQMRQANPAHYHKEVIARTPTPISFHSCHMKHGCDPIQVYNQYLKED